MGESSASTYIKSIGFSQANLPFQMLWLKNKGVMDIFLRGAFGN